jgi:aminodeoxyfutalosine synthase
MDPRLQKIEQKIAAGERLDRDDALALFTTDDLFEVGRIANGQKEKIHGNKIHFGVSLNINHTNICNLRCPICAFSTDDDADNAFFLSQDEISARVANATQHDISEVHIVGGLHDSISLTYFKDMFAEIRRIAPAMNINALTATECDFISRKEDIPLDRLFRELKEAGLGSMPGGGAEILDETIRQQITPRKIPGERWLEVSKAAHKAGIKTNATMLWGHIESYADRVEHMVKLRELQDQTNGFKSFVPLLFHPQNLLHFRQASMKTRKTLLYLIQDHRGFPDEHATVPEMASSFYEPFCRRFIGLLGETLDAINGMFTDISQHLTGFDITIARMRIVRSYP